MRHLRQLFWRWLPHACIWHGAQNARGEHGARCRRCGNAVWFHVNASEGKW